MKSENDFLKMIYSKNVKRETLAYGTYKGYEFRIMNLGTHPTAYVNIPSFHPCFLKTYNELYDSSIDINVHGGLTFSSNQIGTESGVLTGWWLGWDYAHYGDYLGYEMMFPEELHTNDKKWTTKEIFKDVKSVIEQLIKVQNA